MSVLNDGTRALQEEPSTLRVGSLSRVLSEPAGATIAAYPQLVFPESGYMAVTWGKMRRARIRQVETRVTRSHVHVTALCRVGVNLLRPSWPGFDRLRKIALTKNREYRATIFRYCVTKKHRGRGKAHSAPLKIAPRWVALGWGCDNTVAGAAITRNDSALPRNATRVQSMLSR